MRKTITSLFLLVCTVPLLNADPPSTDQGGVKLIPGAEIPVPKKLPPAGTLFNRREKTDNRFDVEQLQYELEQLRKEREALGAARTDPGEQPPRESGATPLETAKMRLRLAELLARTGALTRSRPADTMPPVPWLDPKISKPEEKSAEPPSSPGVNPPSGTGMPVDPLALANALFGAGDFERALKTYRQINLTGMKPEERVPIQYLIATCLRRQGNTDEAVRIYREVAGSKGDEMVAEAAQWQLQSMRWRQEVEGQIKELRQRRGKEAKP